MHPRWSAATCAAIIGKAIALGCLCVLTGGQGLKTVVDLEAIEELRAIRIGVPEGRTTGGG